MANLKSRWRGVKLWFKIRKELYHHGKNTPITLKNAFNTLVSVLYYLGRQGENSTTNAFYTLQADSISLGMALLGVTNKEDTMENLGITPAEIMSALPTLLSEAWGHFSDDKKISGDEGVLLVATMLELMAERTDSAEYADFFGAQAAAFRMFASLLEDKE